jgi:hypothetical protein
MDAADAEKVFATVSALSKAMQAKYGF